MSRLPDVHGLIIDVRTNRGGDEGLAQRVATGIAPTRVAVLLAVLRKHAAVDVSGHDVFINVVSGIRIQEPAADLGVVAAVVARGPIWVFPTSTAPPSWSRAQAVAS